MRKNLSNQIIFRKLNKIPELYMYIFFFIKFNSYTCLFIVEINEICILIYKKLNQETTREMKQHFLSTVSEILLALIVELLNDESLQKIMKYFYTKPKLELHSER